jgi:hypothetical protein
MSTHKKPISKAELLQKNQEAAWQNEHPEYDEFSQRAIKGLQYHNPNEPLRSTLGRLQQQLAPSQSTQRIRPIRRMLSVAAGFLILVIGVYLLYLQAPNQQDASFMAHFSYLPSAMEEGSSRTTDAPTAGNLKLAAIGAYEGEEYFKAEGLFRAYIAENPGDEEMKFYYGIILLGNEKGAAALPLLQQMSLNPVRKAYERPAKWYTALAFLQAQQEDEAMKLLQALKGGDDKYARNAAELLKALE